VSPAKTASRSTIELSTYEKHLFAQVRKEGKPEELVAETTRILVCDGRLKPGPIAVRLHMILEAKGLLEPTRERVQHMLTNREGLKSERVAYMELLLRSFLRKKLSMGWYQKPVSA